jgi:hypothetical protein
MTPEITIAIRNKGLLYTGVSIINAIAQLARIKRSVKIKIVFISLKINGAVE